MTADARRASMLTLALFACAPSAEWSSAPNGTKSALVAVLDQPIRAFGVDDEWSVAFQHDDVVEIAYFDQALEGMALTPGEVPILEGGNVLPSPIAVLRRRPEDRGWMPADELGVRLKAVRTAPVLVEGCTTFELVPSVGVPPDVLWLLDSGDGGYLMGDSFGRVWRVDNADRPIAIPVQVRNGGDLPQLRVGTKDTGDDPFAFADSDGALWHGRYEDDVLQVEQIGTSTGGILTHLAGTVEPLNLHALIGSGVPGPTSVQWMRFDGTWTKMAELPQAEIAAYFDLEFIAPDDIYAVVWTERDGVFHFDGTDARRERTPEPFSDIANIPNIGVVGTSFNTLYVLDDTDGWKKLGTLTNELVIDEPPHESIPYGSGLLTFGHSFVTQYVDGIVCPPLYIWPLKRFVHGATIGRDVIIGAVGEPGSTLLRYIRAVD